MILDKFNLKGKSGIVTGAGSGIGFGLATGLVQAGAEIAIAGRNLKKLEKAAEGLRQYGGPVISLQTDMGKMQDIKNLVDNTVKEFGKIDFLFNNAGIIRRNPCEDFLESDWDDMLNINVNWGFFTGAGFLLCLVFATGFLNVGA
jgi:2-deoxy-D-gluconate 3-dehydrogenase